MSEALVCYRTAEEAKAALADINIYQGWVERCTEVLAKMSKLE